MTVLGYDTVGASDATYSADTIFGSVFSATEDGVVSSVSVALKATSAKTVTARCGIYNHADLSLLATSQTLTINLTTAYQWFQFDFNFPCPEIANGTDYLLVCWVDYTDTNILCPYDSGAANQQHTKATAWAATFPDPLVGPTHGNNQMSIYCSYNMDCGSSFYYYYRKR